MEVFIISIGYMVVLALCIVLGILSAIVALDWLIEWFRQKKYIKYFNRNGDINYLKKINISNRHKLNEDFIRKAISALNEAEL